MHIAYVTPEYPSLNRPDGGLANYIRKVAVEFNKRGHIVSVIYPDDKYVMKNDQGINVYSVPKHFHNNLVNVPGLRGSLKVLRQIVVSRRIGKMLWKIHADKKIDIIQSSNYMTPGLALLNNRKIPLVCRVSSVRNLWRIANGNKDTIFERIYDKLEIRQLIGADAIISPSNFLAGKLEKHQKMDIQVIRTPFPLNSLFSNQDDSIYLKHLDGLHYLTFFGTMSLLKGCDFIAEILPQLFNKYTALHMVFIGRDGGLHDQQTMTDYIRQKCSTFPERLHFFPPMEQAKLFSIVGKSVGAILPSRVDNYPNTCLEALSLGVPVIGTNHSSLEEMIIDNQTGFLAENGSPHSLLESTEKLLNISEEDRVKIRQNIQKYLDDMLQRDVFIDLLLYYEKIIRKFHNS